MVHRRVDVLDPIMRQVRADLRHAKVLVNRAEKARARKEEAVDHYRGYQSTEGLLAGTAASFQSPRQQPRKARKTRETSGEPQPSNPG